MKDSEVGEEIIYVDAEEKSNKIEISNALLHYETKSTWIVRTTYSQGGELMLKLHAGLMRFAHRLCPRLRYGGDVALHSS